MVENKYRKGYRKGGHVLSLRIDPRKEEEEEEKNFLPLRPNAITFAPVEERERKKWAGGGQTDNERPRTSHRPISFRLFSHITPSRNWLFLSIDILLSTVLYFFLPRGNYDHQRIFNFIAMDCGRSRLFYIVFYILPFHKSFD